MPCFAYEKNNPRNTNYNDEAMWFGRENWRRIICQTYSCGLPEPKEDEILYKLRGSENRGYLLKLNPDKYEFNPDEKTLRKVKAIQDDSGHWYVIPNELGSDFNNDCENEDMCDSGEFDNKWGEYRTGGDLNLVQLYAVI